MRGMGAAAVMILLLGCASLAPEEKTKEASAHYQLGISYLNDNNIQPAFVEFQKALELDPNNKDVLNAIGFVYLIKLEDYPKAIDYFQRALRIDKDFSEAWNNLGGAYYQSGRFNDAAESYRKALSNPLYRNAEKALYHLGGAYYRMRKYQEAIDAYKEAIKRFTDFPQPYYGLALANNASGKYDAAATALKRAIELDPAFKGDRGKALAGMRERKLIASGDEEKDLEDLLEIINY